METVAVSRDYLEKVIKDLESAINVCCNVDYGVDSSDPKNVEKTSAFANGYSRSTMQHTVSDLKKFLN